VTSSGKADVPVVVTASANVKEIVLPTTASANEPKVTRPNPLFYPKQSKKEGKKQRALFGLLGHPELGTLSKKRSDIVKIEYKPEEGKKIGSKAFSNIYIPSEQEIALPKGPLAFERSAYEFGILSKFASYKKLSSNERELLLKIYERMSQTIKEKDLPPNVKDAMLNNVSGEMFLLTGNLIDSTVFAP
jgi:hypothetical protein